MRLASWVDRPGGGLATPKPSGHVIPVAQADVQCPDKSLEGASNVLRQPETAVDLETDEAVKCAPCHSGGIDCCEVRSVPLWWHRLLRPQPARSREVRRPQSAPRAQPRPGAADPGSRAPAGSAGSGQGGTVHSHGRRAPKTERRPAPTGRRRRSREPSPDRPSLGRRLSAAGLRCCGHVCTGKVWPHQCGGRRRPESAGQVRVRQPVRPLR